MSDFRNRPNGTYIFESDLQRLYALTKHWESDLLFYKDDLNFLSQLINKYFIWISKKEDVEAVRNIQVNIDKTEMQCSDLLKRVNKQLNHFANMTDNPFKYDTHQFRTEHQQLENDIADFTKAFRANRKEVFAVTKHVIESDEFIRNRSFS